MPVALEYRSDHLLVRLVGPSVLSSLRRTVLVPYSDVEDVTVEPARWPSLLKQWRIGTHVPGVIASGTFVSWRGKHRRFVHFDRATDQVLTLRLKRHPSFDEISIDCPDAEAARKEIERRRAATQQG